MLPFDFEVFKNYPVVVGSAKIRGRVLLKKIF